MTTLLLFLAGITTAHADPDQVAFRGIKWGAKCSEVEEFKPVKNTEGSGRLFHRLDDHMKLDTTRLKSIQYLCISDEFVEVQLVVDANDFEVLVPVLVEHWGKGVWEQSGTKPNPFIDPYVYGGREGKKCYLKNEPGCPAVLARIHSGYVDSHLLIIQSRWRKAQLIEAAKKQKLREAAERIKQDL
jgi:hypothetical protein